MLLQAPFRHLNKQDLDAISTTRPIVVIANTAHTGYANSIALANAGITKDTPPFPGGGVFEKDPSGELNGIFVESAVLVMVNKYMNLPTNQTQSIQGVLKYLNVMASQGITGIGDGVTGTTLGIQTEIGVWLSILNATGPAAFSTRIVLNPDAKDVQNATAVIKALGGKRITPYGTVSMTGDDPLVSVARAKLFLDGSTQSETAAQTQPYLPDPQAPNAPEVYGSLNYNDSAVTRLIQLAKDNGFSMQAHCNGDKAADQFLASLTNVFVNSGGNVTTRNYVEHLDNAFPRKFGKRKFPVMGDGFRPLMIHATNVRTDQYDTMVKLNVTPTYLIPHVYYWGRSFKDTLLGDPRAANMDGAQYAVQRGLPFSAHSDAPIVEVPEPMTYISTFVTRLVMQGPGAPYAQGGDVQKVSVIEGLSFSLL